MSAPSIIVDGVTKEFRMHLEKRNTLKERFVKGAPRGRRTFKALDNVSFEVPKGSTMGLIGHNGSGKSTMLKLLAGVYRPTEGSIAVGGRVSALLELGAGFHGELTGRENIRLNGAILGFSKRQIEYSMDKIIEFADIGDFIDAPVKIYSSGMYVRLGFAVAVMLDPEILIVDEIIAVGDEEFQRKCFDYLFKLRSQGVTIALVTHSMGLARELADEAIWLSHGKELAQGPSSVVVAQYLESVNEAEAASQKGTGQDAEGRGRSSGAGPWAGHLGSGEARVVSASLLSDDGEPLSFATPGQPIKIRIEVIGYEALSDAVVGMGLLTENGLFLTGANSGERDVTYDLSAGLTQIEFSMDHLILQPGTYRIAASISKKGYTYDYSDEVGTLLVRSNVGELEPGYFRLEGDWLPEKKVLGGEGS